MSKNINALNLLCGIGKSQHCLMGGGGGGGVLAVIVPTIVAHVPRFMSRIVVRNYPEDKKMASIKEILVTAR